MNFRSILYPVLTEPVNTAPERVSEDKWHQPLSQPTYRAGLSVAVVIAGCLLAPQNTFAETVTESRWHEPLSQPTYRAGLHQSLIANSNVVVPPIVSTSIEWHQPLSLPSKKLPTYPDANTLTQAAPFFETVTEARWHQPLSTPIPPYKLPIFPAITGPVPVLIPSTVWVQPLSQPVVKATVPTTTEVKAPYTVASTLPYVNSDVVEADSGTIAWPAGTTAGDSAILLLFGNGACTMTGTGWTQDINHVAIDGFSFYSAWHKSSLSAGEISSPFTFTGTDFGGYIVYVVRGATGINYITNTVAPTSATNTLTGFTKSSSSFFIASLIFNRNGSPVTIGAPSGFTDRAQEATTFFTCDKADILPAGYTNGSSVVWSGLDAGQSSGSGLWEFTSGESVTLDRWYHSLEQPTRARQPLIPGPALAPTTVFAESVTEDRWHLPLSQPTYRAGYPLATTSSGNIVDPLGRLNFFSSSFYGPLSQPTYRAGLSTAVTISSGVTYTTPDTFPESITESRWHQPLAQPTYRAGYPQAVILSGNLLAPANFFAEAITEDRWHQPLYTPYRPAGLPLASYSSSILPGFVQETVSEDKWHQGLSQPTYRAGYPLSVSVSGNYFTPATPFAETVSEDKWHQALAQPTYRAGLSTAVITSGNTLLLQQISTARIEWYAANSEPTYRAGYPLAVFSGATNPPISPFNETIFESEWHQSLSQPTYRAGLNTAIIVSGAVAPAKTDGVKLDWVQAFPQPYLLKTSTPLAVTISGGLTPPVSPFNEAVTEDRWHQGLVQPTYRTWPNMMAIISGGIMPPITNNTELVSEDKYHQPISVPTRRPGLPLAVTQASTVFGSPDLPNPTPPPRVGTVWQPLYYTIRFDIIPV